MTIRHGEFERLSDILRRLALRPDTTPEDKLALKTATQALFFVVVKYPTDFAVFLGEIAASLTAEEKAKLKDIGLTE